MLSVIFLRGKVLNKFPKKITSVHFLFYQTRDLRAEMSTCKSKSFLNCSVFALQRAKPSTHRLPGLQAEHGTRCSNRRLLELRTPANTGHPEKHDHNISALSSPTFLLLQKSDSENMLINFWGKSVCPGKSQDTLGSVPLSQVSPGQIRVMLS